VRIRQVLHGRGLPSRLLYSLSVTAAARLGFGDECSVARDAGDQPFVFQDPQCFLHGVGGDGVFGGERDDGRQGSPGCQFAGGDLVAQQGSKLL